MVEGLLRDVVISLGFMAIFFGASLLFGTESKKRVCVSCVAKEELEKGKDGFKFSALDYQKGR
ncbi:MAG: hypothetical protein LBQ03_00785 [Puniceicoccales bacterium]|jgi:hypothetical protein|nr:hypothetical protein [Puniceicoccales bacterium]